MDLDMTLTEILLSTIAVFLCIGFHGIQSTVEILMEKMEDIQEKLQVLVEYQEQDHGENTDRYDDEGDDHHEF